MEVQTLNGRTLIFELLSSVHQHGRFLVASAQFSAFKIFREYIYIYIRSLKFTAYSSASRYNSSRHHRETILDERENDLKKDKERKGGEGGKK